MRTWPGGATVLGAHVNLCHLPRPPEPDELLEFLTFLPTKDRLRTYLPIIRWMIDCVERMFACSRTKEQILRMLFRLLDIVYGSASGRFESNIASGEEGIAKSFDDIVTRMDFGKRPLGFKVVDKLANQANDELDEPIGNLEGSAEYSDEETYKIFMWTLASERSAESARELLLWMLRLGHLMLRGDSDRERKFYVAMVNMVDMAWTCEVRLANTDEYLGDEFLEQEYSNLVERMRSGSLSAGRIRNAIDRLLDPDAGDEKEIDDDDDDDSECEDEDEAYVDQTTVLPEGIEGYVATIRKESTAEIPLEKTCTRVVQGSRVSYALLAKLLSKAVLASRVARDAARQLWGAVLAADSTVAERVLPILWKKLRESMALLVAKSPRTEDRKTMALLAAPKTEPPGSTAYWWTSTVDLSPDAPKGTNIGCRLLRFSKRFESVCAIPGFLAPRVS